jgi:hypothetical protein
MLLSRTERSPHHRTPFDWIGQITAVAAMGGLTYAAIGGGSHGFTEIAVLTVSASPASPWSPSWPAKRVCRTRWCRSASSAPAPW